MTDTKEGGRIVGSRREFLKLAAAGAPLAAAAAVAAPAQAAEPAPTSLGMKKTEHVKKYLETARF